MNLPNLRNEPALAAPAPPKDVDAWRQDAACVYTDDPDVFFADVEDLERIRYARAVCIICPVRYPCLLDAVSHPKIEDEGIRANTTSRERDTLRAQGFGRCDPERVDRVLGGTRGFLSEAERRLAVARTIELGLPAQRLAHALGVTLEYARRLIAAERKARALDVATDPGKSHGAAQEAA